MFQKFTLSKADNLSLLNKVCRVFIIVFGLFMLIRQLFFPATVHAQDTSDSGFTLKWIDSEVGSTTDLSWGDMDGDGDLDLAVGQAVDQTATNVIYENRNGFFTRVEIEKKRIDRQTQSLVWGDMDGDGDLDLAAGNFGINQVYRNDRDGIFTSFNLPGGSMNTNSVAWGDMDGDGDLDLAIGNYGTNQVYRNDGNGIFTSFNLPGGSMNTQSVAWGDMDGDGDLDLAAGNEGINQIYRNNGNENFTLQMLDKESEARYTRSIKWGDIDGDNDLDIVAANGDKPELNQLYLNEGYGIFNSIDLPGISAGLSDINLGDMNIDGTLDLARVNFLETFLGSQLQILDNQGSNRFTTTDIAIPIELLNSVAWGDQDNDGDLDLAVGGLGFARIYENTQPMSLQLSTHFTLSTNINSAEWGDMDNDGDLDLVIGNGRGVTGTTELIIYENIGNGKFKPRSLELRKKSQETIDIALGDVDNDFDLDILVANGNSSFGTRTETNIICFNQGNLIFTLKSLENHSNPSNTRSIALGDMDNDGDLDLAVGNDESKNQVYRNDGKIFTNLDLDEQIGGSDTITWLDMDDNTDLDIAAGSNYGTQIYRNHGNSVFASVDLIDDSLANDAGWSDIDGDGDLDLAVGTDFGNRIHRNDGKEIFTSHFLHPLGRATRRIVWKDLNSDGYLDLITLSSQDTRETTQLEEETIESQVYIATDPDFGASHPLNGENVGSGDMAIGDIDNDGDLDLAVVGITSTIYINPLYGNRSLPNNLPIIKARTPYTTPEADFYAVPTVLTSSKITVSYKLSDPENDPVGRVEAFYSLNGGRWLPAIPASGTITTNLATAVTTQITSVQTIPDQQSISTMLALSGSGSIEELEVTLVISHPTSSQLSASLVTPWPAPTGTNILLFSGIGGNRPGFNQLVLSDRGQRPVTDINSVLTTTISGKYQPQMPLSVLHGAPLDTPLTLVISDTVAGQAGTVNKISLKSIGRQYNYVWDTFASGFSGQSDNVVMRFVAYNHPLTTTQVLTGSFLYVNSTGGSHQRAYVSSTTFPFRVRGTQVKVVNEDGSPVSGAKVYRIRAGQTSAGQLIGNNSTIFHTDGQGYLQGRGTLGYGDQLLALAPRPLTVTNNMTWATGLTDTIHLYYTNGEPTEIGVDAWISNTQSVSPTLTVTEPGVQVLQVSPKNPLLLFDLRVALEWDASTDPNEVYLSQLRSDLHKAAEFLYDFTNGQATLGTITVTQNAEDWMFADVFIKATNRLRPLAVQGGVVITTTPDLNEPGITYTPGQVIMGATWNRYGTAGQNLGYDWPLALAHELSHYLFFLDDTYLGLNKNTLLTPVDECIGSVMGDMYDPSGVNTEYIFDQTQWDKNCGQTLAEATLKRTEWATIHQRYPAMTATMMLTGPSAMPFDFTQIEILTPTQSTTTLPDPIFFLKYGDSGTVSSPSARAFLIRNESLLFDLGTAIGGQNRLLARGARPGDVLCVFDPQEKYSGCDKVTDTNERLTLHQDKGWSPQIEIRPVNTTTLNIRVSGVNAATALAARIFPELGNATQPIRLTYENNYYSATIPITYTIEVTRTSTITDDPDTPIGTILTTTKVVTIPLATGHLEIWQIDPKLPITPTVTTTRTIVAFSVGGNFGDDPAMWAVGPYFRIGGPYFRIGGPYFRIGGPYFRIGGPYFRIGGPFQRGSNSPVASTDGQLIIYTEPKTLQPGDLYTVQSVNAYPQLPPNTKPVGLVYDVITSKEGLTGSISFQYLGIDAMSLGLTEEDEQGLTIWYSGTTISGWIPLTTTLNNTYNLASAAIPEKSVSGFYALLAKVRVPSISNIITTTTAITTAIQVEGSNFDANVEALLVDKDGTGYFVPVTVISPTQVMIVLPQELSSSDDPSDYKVMIVKDGHISATCKILYPEQASAERLGLCNEIHGEQR